MEFDEGAMFVSHGDLALVFRHDERRFGLWESTLMGWVYCAGSMTPEFSFFAFDVLFSGLSGDSPATTIACSTMEFHNQGLDLEER